VVCATDLAQAAAAMRSPSVAPLPLLLGVLLGTLVAPAAALGQSTGELAERPDRHRSRFAVDLGFYYGEQRTLLGDNRGRALLVPSLSASIDAVRITDTVSLAVDFAFRSVGTFGRWFLEDRTDFRAGNLQLGARVVVGPIRHLRVRGGLGAVAPFMNVYEGGNALPFRQADIATVQVPLSGLPNGAWDPWLFARGYLPIVLRADAEYREDFWFFGGETALGVGVPVLEGYDGASIGAQLGLFGGVRPIPELAAGLRLQTVMYDVGRIGGAESDAVGFFTLVPFVRGELNAVFAELRFFINVADNVAYDALGEKAWGLYLQVGSDFDVR
jgi:hypothetical protein